MRRFLLILIPLLLVAGTLFAVEPDEILPDPSQELRARELSRSLRCMVCQNQSIDDSEAPLARDLRLIVRERIRAGDSDVQIQNFLVARYGEFVLLKPPLNTHTVLLWAIPGLILMLGATVIALARKNRGKSRPTALSREERQRLASIIKQSDDLTDL